MTDLTSRYDTYFYRVENNIPTHRDDIGTLAGRKNKLKLSYATSYRRQGKFANTNDCIDIAFKYDIMLTLLEDGHIDHEEFKMRMKKLSITNMGLNFINPAFQSGLESRRRTIVRKSSVFDRLRKKHCEKYCK